MSVNKLEILNPSEYLQQMFSEYTEYMKVAEQEQTARRKIDAWEHTNIAQIDAQRDVLMAYMEHSFVERADNIRFLLCIVERVIASGDNEQLALVLNSITEIAKSSPFKEFANLTNEKFLLKASGDGCEHSQVK